MNRGRMEAFSDGVIAILMTIIRSQGAESRITQNDSSEDG